ncbi:MAG: DUF493 family protein [Victivallaceae bacterium]|jgi:putative lipoic acid-binding regulatory protein|nr:DUF493 family protein [Victivallaceae bacterium]NLK83257.1 DUF493 family protein [Lentisphaerota bacterium]MDD3117521.1 DUF493 family protein [Victivallaceae bacterium]MDD3702722.1 DUF493 family protein [Victivallaceae bacterium]MDD4317836.1 DUF493 family protein [Victivallaceae bacterium]
MFDKQELKFPVDWEFRIVTEQDKHPGVFNELSKVLTSFRICAPLKTGRESSGGKYLTCMVKVSFPDRQYMESVSAALAKVPGVKMVI